MKTRTPFSMLLFAVSMIAPIAATGQAVYPEYAGKFDIRECYGKYSSPTFGGMSMYWIREWNTPGYKNGSWDGISYDGIFLFDPPVSNRENKVYFRLENVDPVDLPPSRYFKLDQVVKNDPRLSILWMASCVDSAGSLAEAVANATAIEGSSMVTRQIVNHMIASGVVKSSELSYMPLSRIREVMVAYTNIALKENVRQTLGVIHTDQISITKVLKAKPGDLLYDFRWPRYGPRPIPARTLEITKINRDGGVEVRSSNGQETYSWQDFDSPFVALRSVK